MDNEIDLGNLPVYVSVDAYQAFMNQKESGEGKASRAVFKFDYQRFAWAFVLGISAGKRKEIEGKKESAFKWQRFPDDMKIMIIALALQERYKDNPDEFKADIDSMGEGFNQELKKTIEEYANAGFNIMLHKKLDDSGYIEDFEAVIKDILSDDSAASDGYFE